MRAALFLLPFSLFFTGCGDKDGTSETPSGGDDTAITDSGTDGGTDGGTTDGGTTDGGTTGSTDGGGPGGTDGGTECEELAWYDDLDHDGYGDPDAVTLACEQPDGTVGNDRDCDDGDPLSWPGADELCDLADNDCDDAADEGLALLEWWPDTDEDGFGDIEAEPVQDCAAPDRHVDNAMDCDDADAGARPAFVDAAAESGGDGRPATPYNNLQGAIRDGEVCIQVTAGSYEPIALDEGQVRIVGEGPDTTRILGDGSTGAGACVEATGTADLTLEGFTLSDCAGYESEYTCSGYDACYIHYGGGVYQSSGVSVTLRDAVVSDMALPYGAYAEGARSNYRYGYGGGFANFSGALTLEDVAIRGNFALYGAAMYNNYGTVSMTRVMITGNESYYGTVYGYQTEIAASALIVASNAAGYGMFYLNYGSAVIDHATFAGNRSYSGLTSIDIHAAYTEVKLSNSILAFNEYYGIQDDYGTVVAEYVDLYGAGRSDVYNSVAIAGSDQISVDPQFVDFRDDGIDEDDLTLLPGSGCIDAGSPDHTDLDGSAPDLGAYGGPDAF